MRKPRIKFGRLRRLVKILREDAKNKFGAQFNLLHWAAPSPASSPSEFSGVFSTKPKRPLKVDCGTSACAMGLAVITGEFAKEGLYARYYEATAGWRMEPAIKAKAPGWGSDSEETGFDAAKELFGITLTQAEFLFAPSRYAPKYRKGAVGERYVANRIKKLIEANGRLPYGITQGYELNKHFYWNV